MDLTGNEGSQDNHHRIVLPSAGTQAPQYPPAQRIPPRFYPLTRAGLSTHVYPPGFLPPHVPKTELSGPATAFGPLKPAGFFATPRPAAGLKIEPSHNAGPSQVLSRDNFASTQNPSAFSEVPKIEPSDDAGSSHSKFNPFI